MNLHDDRIADFIEGCYRAGIKNPVSFLESKRPQVYDWLKDCFPRGILPTDIDGEVELNGFFLRLEFKDETALRNGYVARGQRRALEQLVKTGHFTVFIIGTGRLGEPTCVEIYTRHAHTELKDATKESLRAHFKRWAKLAEGGQLKTKAA